MGEVQITHKPAAYKHITNHLSLLHVKIAKVLYSFFKNNVL